MIFYSLVLGGGAVADSLSGGGKNSHVEKRKGSWKPIWGLHGRRAANIGLPSMFLENFAGPSDLFQESYPWRPGRKETDIWAAASVTYTICFGSRSLSFSLIIFPLGRQENRLLFAELWSNLSHPFDFVFGFDMRRPRSIQHVLKDINDSFCSNKFR
jgi:hypothetical protein